MMPIFTSRKRDKKTMTGNESSSFLRADNKKGLDGYDTGIDILLFDKSNNLLLKSSCYFW